MSADQIKPGNPGITGRAAGNRTINDASIPVQDLPDGTRSASVDTTGGNIQVNLPNAQGYAGSSIALDFVAGGNQLTLAAASGNTILGPSGTEGPSETFAATGLFVLIPFGTRWRVVVSA